MAEDAIYYKDKRRVGESVGCIATANVFSDRGVKLINEGTVIDPQIADSLKKHDISELEVYRKLQENYASVAEVETDILASFRIAVKGIVNGYEMKTEIKDKLFDILYYVNKLNFNSMLSYIKHVERIDNFTYLHSLNLSWLIIRVGVLLKLQKDTDLIELMLAGLFHDIGKVSIPHNVLNKQGRLNDEEMALVRRHPILGHSMIQGLVSDRVAIGLLQHHEKLNGKGYPAGIFDEDITLFARILSVADVFEALIAKRPYKHRMTQLRALEILREMAFLGDLDYKIVNLFSICVLDSMIGERITDKDGNEKMFIGYDKNTLQLYLFA